MVAAGGERLGGQRGGGGGAGVRAIGSRVRRRGAGAWARAPEAVSGRRPGRAPRGASRDDAQGRARHRPDTFAHAPPSRRPITGPIRTSRPIPMLMARKKN
ncbi:hypothetical protein R5R35_001533 [Gryllus longicercus]|uniref:Uncharacterized protein n=1 Tax=Gryllus longicercus TaxID=2509291 RepID=A0AAN9ZAD4_9ORTH